MLFFHCVLARASLNCSGSRMLVQFLAICVRFFTAVSMVCSASPFFLACHAKFINVWFVYCAVGVCGAGTVCNDASLGVPAQNNRRHLSPHLLPKQEPRKERRQSICRHMRLPRSTGTRGR